MGTTEDVDDGMSPAEFARRCRQLVGKRGLEVLAAHLEDPDPKTQLQALKLLSAYAYGLPAAQVVVENRLVDPAHVLPEAEAAELRAMYRREMREMRQKELPTLTRVK